MIPVRLVLKSKLYKREGGWKLSLPKLSHSLLKGQSFGAEVVSKLKNPVEKENLSPHFDETWVLGY